MVNGKIMISGGYAKNDSVFSYNPDVNTWSKMQPMNKGRDSHVMLTTNGKVYAIGKNYYLPSHCLQRYMIL